MGQKGPFHRVYHYHPAQGDRQTKKTYFIEKWAKRVPFTESITITLGYSGYWDGAWGHTLFFEDSPLAVG